LSDFESEFDYSEEDSDEDNLDYVETLDIENWLQENDEENLQLAGDDREAIGEDEEKEEKKISNYCIDDKGNEISIAKFLSQETFSLHTDLIQSRKFRVRGASANPEQLQIYCETFKKVPYIACGGMAAVYFEQNDSSKEIVYLGRVLKILSGNKIIDRLDIENRTGKEKINFKWYLENDLSTFKFFDHEYMSKNVICGVIGPDKFSIEEKENFLKLIVEEMEKEKEKKRKEKKTTEYEIYEKNYQPVSSGTSRYGRQFHKKTK